MNIIHNNTKPCFSINEYDKDGDISEEGIFLHFGDTRIKVGNSLKELELLENNIYGIRKELEENYNLEKE